MGRKRKHNKAIPAHIDQSKLPDGIYFDSTRERGHWYTVYKDERGKNRRKRLAGEKALLSQLHQLIEEFNGKDLNNFAWLAGLYFESAQFSDLAKRTRENYQYCYDVVAQLPTKINKPLANVELAKWDRVLIQKLVDKLSDKPTKAKHVRSFVRLIFEWGMNRGYCTNNPAAGRIEMPKERKKQTLPTQRAYDKLLAHAKAKGTYGQKIKGSCPHYIWAVMEVEYLCRLRGIECRTINDSNLLDNGLLVHRRKGSKTNITEFNQRLSSVIAYLQECRADIWEKRKKPHPMNPENRPIVINTFGEPLKERAYKAAWQRFVVSAIENKIIDASERFSLHDLKRKGITDTDGSQSEKMDASGHKDGRMMDVYDKSIKTVKPTSD